MDVHHYLLLQNALIAISKPQSVVLYDGEKLTPYDMTMDVTGAAPKNYQLTYGIGCAAGLRDIETGKDVWESTNQSKVVFGSALYNGSNRLLTCNRQFLQVMDSRLDPANSVIAKYDMSGDHMKMMQLVKNGTNQGTTQAVYAYEFGIVIVKFRGADKVVAQTFKHNLKDVAIANMDAIWAGDITYVVILTKNTFLRNNVMLFALEGNDKITKIKTRVILESVCFVTSEAPKVGTATLTGVTADDLTAMTWTLQGASIVNPESIVIGDEDDAEDDADEDASMKVSHVDCIAPGTVVMQSEGRKSKGKLVQAWWK